MSESSLREIMRKQRQDLLVKAHERGEHKTPNIFCPACPYLMPVRR